jgi:hypothetical protein
MITLSLAFKLDKFLEISDILIDLLLPDSHFFTFSFSINTNLYSKLSMELILENQILPFDHCKLKLND